MSASEVEVRAKGMGWQPKEQFRGDPEKWVPAETFVERGETFVPYLKANNRKLEDKLNHATSEIGSLKELIKSQQEQVEALLEYNTKENKATVETQRKVLVKGIKEARAEGDVEPEEDLREQLRSAQDALAKADEKKPAVTPPAHNLQPTAEVKAAFETFVSNHDWYNEDHMMKSAFIGTMQTKMLDPKFAQLADDERIV